MNEATVSALMDILELIREARDDSPFNRRDFEQHMQIARERIMAALVKE